MTTIATKPTMASASRDRMAWGRVWWVGLLAAAVATGGNVMIYTLARALGVPLVMPLMPDTPLAMLPVAMVIVMSVLGAAAGTVVFALLGRFAPRRVSLFTIIGVVFLFLSFGGPLTLEGTQGATKATLMLMHVVAGGSIIGLLSGLGSSRRRLTRS